MDGLIADRFHVPVGEERYYIEAIIRLPHAFMCFDPPACAPPVSPLPAGHAGPLTFAAFHNPARINKEVVQLWSRVLQQQAASRICFSYAGYELPNVQTRIRRWFSEAGIEGERIGFSGRVPRQDMLARYGETDIALDPLPYSGSTTTCEALWMGVPVVTLPGQTFAGRHSLSFLSKDAHGRVTSLRCQVFGQHLGAALRTAWQRWCARAQTDALQPKRA